jgi:hypothetical protein
MRKYDLRRARCVILVATAELFFVGGGLYLARSTDDLRLAFAATLSAYLLATLASRVGKDICHRRELANTLCDPT